MNKKDLLYRATELRNTALNILCSHQNCIWIEDDFSAEYKSEINQLSLYEFAEDILGKDHIDIEMKYLATAIEFGIITHEDVVFETTLLMNASKFGVFASAIESYQNNSYSLELRDWDESIHFEFIIDTLIMYFGKDSNKVKKLWNSLDWERINQQDTKYFRKDILEEMENLFGEEGFSEDAARLYLVLI
ncbi:hypothetical protein BK010_00485 [Tenericutes bacterium MO-XQ]|nr:hypothetical protein BK010_00485 [Tenericutes bacterium MO-XQ]